METVRTDVECEAVVAERPSQPAGPILLFDHHGRYAAIGQEGGEAQAANAGAHYHNRPMRLLLHARPRKFSFSRSNTITSLIQGFDAAKRPVNGIESA